jgi:hypothetical protein
MKRFKLVLAIAAIAGSALTAAWHDVKSTQGRFTVQMPGKPTVQRQALETSAGPIDLTLTYCANEKAAYFVAFCDYGMSFKSTDEKYRVLYGARDGLVAQVQGQVLGEKKVSISGHPGLRIRFTGSGYHGLSHLYLVGDRLYQVMTISDEKGISDPSVEQFIASFRLIK